MSSPASTTKGRATRERIVASAATLMHQRGVAGTNTAAVREDAGVSASQVYHYFADKEDLTRAVVAHQVAAVVGTQTDDLATVGNLAGLAAWRDRLVDDARAGGGAGGCPVGGLAAELADSSPWARAELETAFARWRDALRDVLTRVVDAGRLREDAPVETLADALLAAVQGGLLLAQVTHRADALEAAVDTVLEQVRTFAT